MESVSASLKVLELVKPSDGPAEKALYDVAVEYLTWYIRGYLPSKPQMSAQPKYPAPWDQRPVVG